MMPISCMECRRRKIKCNKMVPCNQCMVKNKKCEYPSKFRSLRVDQLVVDSIPPNCLADKHDVVDTTSSNDEVGKIQEQSIGKPPKINHEDTAKTIPSLKKRKTDDDIKPQSSTISELYKENEVLRLKIRDLRLRSKRQRRKLRKYMNEQEKYGEITDDSCEEYDNSEDNSNSNCKDESPKDPGSSTTYSKDQQHSQQIDSSAIYYGPNSTRYMMKSSMSRNEISEFDDFVRIKRQIKQKRSLPQLVKPKINSAKARRVAAKENMEAITGLIKKFFHLKVHYMNYISPKPILDLFDKYEEIKVWNRGDQDQLLLAIMIMIVSLRSIPPNDPLLTKYGLSYHNNRESLYKQYKNLKRGIQLETTTSLRAYVLECEDLFFNGEIEKSWHLLFHLVGSAYSLGLHVYDESIVTALKSAHCEKAGDIIIRNPKTSLWLIINFISATLCSVLGRPNPVTFNFQPLLKNYEIRLNYKIALADLVKRSTSILIDSYKLPIDQSTVLGIDEMFVNEVLIYEKILIDTRIMRNMKSRQLGKAAYINLPVIDKSQSTRLALGRIGPQAEWTSVSNIIPGPISDSPISENANDQPKSVPSVDNHLNNIYPHFQGTLEQKKVAKLLSECPLDIRFTILRPCPLQDEEESWCMILEDGDTLCDLIMLDANRAKFNQHFMAKYTKSLESCLDSILRVLEHTQDLMELTIKKQGEPAFQRMYPFFYVFLYQTLIVMYTLMHLGYAKLSPYYGDIGIIRQHLVKLFDCVGVTNWKPNVVRIVQYINDMCDTFFKTHMEKEREGPQAKKEATTNSDAENAVHHIGGNNSYQSTYTLIQESGAVEQQPKLKVQPQVQRQTQNPSARNVSALTPNEHAGSVASNLCGLQSHFGSLLSLNSLLNAVPPDDKDVNEATDFREKRTVPGNANCDQSRPDSSRTTTSSTYPASTSQSLLSNYNIDYYNSTQPFYPPPSSMQRSSKPGQPVATFIVDPLLGFDLNDPFAVQNPLNFRYASTNDGQQRNSIDGQSVVSDPAEFLRQDSTSTVTVISNDRNDPDRLSTNSSLA